MLQSKPVSIENMSPLKACSLLTSILQICIASVNGKLDCIEVTLLIKILVFRFLLVIASVDGNYIK